MDHIAVPLAFDAEIILILGGMRHLTVGERHAERHRDGRNHREDAARPCGRAPCRDAPYTRMRVH